MRRVVIFAAVAIAAIAGACDRPTGNRGPLASSSAAPRASASAASDHRARLDAIAWPETAIDWARPLPTSPVVQAGYVGSKACETCHKTETDKYARHSMAQTGIRPLKGREKELARAFDLDQTVRHEGSGMSYRPIHAKGKFYVEEFMNDAAGKRIHSWTQPVTHTFASGAFGQAFTFEQGERHYQVPIVWYPFSKRWSLDPTFQRFGYHFEASCTSCHGDYPAHRAGNTKAILGTPSPGIGCERCHGPGERHLKSARKEDVVNPARLTAAQQRDVCAQCHLEGFLPEPLRIGRSPYSYRPGEPLDAFRLNFVETDAHRDFFQFTGHSDRMTRSACFRGAPDKLVCTTCHDPHKSSREETPAHWRDACVSCHQEKQCSLPLAERQAKGDQCPTCHMRKETPLDFRERLADVPLPVTDHWIQRRPSAPTPAGTPVVPLPIASMSSHASLVGQHPSGPDVAVLHGMALWGNQHRDEAAAELIAGVNAGLPMPRLYDLVARYYEGDLGAATSKEQKGAIGARVRLARAAEVRAAPDDVDALVRYARALLTVNQNTADAARALDRALALDPNDQTALEEKGGYLFRAGRFEAAIPFLERATKMGPHPVEAQVLLAVIARDAGHDDEAAAWFEAVRKSEPYDRWVLGQLLKLYRRMGAKTNDKLRDVEKSIAAFDAARIQSVPRTTHWLTAKQRE